MKSGDVMYAYGRDIERILRLQDSLVTISNCAVQKNGLHDVSLEGSVEFRQDSE